MTKRVHGSLPVWRNGRRRGLKIPRALKPVRVRIPPPAPAFALRFAAGYGWQAAFALRFATAGRPFQGKPHAGIFRSPLNRTTGRQKEDRPSAPIPLYHSHHRGPVGPIPRPNSKVALDSAKKSTA